MSTIWNEQKHQVVWGARRMAALGLVSGTSGNVSLRLTPLDGNRELMAVTPSGKSYDTLTDQDVVVVDFEGEPVEGNLVPSSESLMHAAIYGKRPDVKAVVHSHSVFCSVAAVVGLDIPPVIDEVVVTVGGTIKVSDHAFPGTQELADKVCVALGERNAALLRNHGAVAVGRTVREAVDISALVERMAQVFIYASLLGGANPLPPEVVETELAIFHMRRQATEGEG